MFFPLYLRKDHPLQSYSSGLLCVVTITAVACCGRHYKSCYCHLCLWCTSQAIIWCQWCINNWQYGHPPSIAAWRSLSPFVLTLLKPLLKDTLDDDQKTFCCWNRETLVRWRRALGLRYCSWSDPRFSVLWQDTDHANNVSGNIDCFFLFLTSRRHLCKSAGVMASA